MLDARRLRVFCEVARTGSFSAAGVSLGYTQPAVSRQIATLESEVGMALVRRVPQGAVLTDAGRLLAERGEAILARLAETEQELRALAGLEGGTLKMASFASAAAAIVPEAVARFRARHPSVELQIVMADPWEALPRLRAGELDLALSHDRDALEASAAEASAVDFELLFEDPMYVALPVGHRLAGAPEVRLEEFREEPWMLATLNTCPDSRLFRRSCTEAGFEPRIAFQNDDYGAILGFVAAGVGVALVPDMVVRQVRSDVVIRALSPRTPARPICAAIPAGYRSPAVEAMLDVLRGVAADWVASTRSDAGSGPAAAGPDRDRASAGTDPALAA